MLALWPTADGREEYAVAFDRGRRNRVLFLPALFEEGNKLRHLTLETMRALDRGGVDCFLPDLAGCNESLASMADQDLESWRSDASSAARHFDVTHVLAMRAGSLIVPQGLAGWSYAPAKGASILATMLRAGVLSAREAGREKDRDSLLAEGLANGLELAGFALSRQMIAQLQTAQPAEQLAPISQGLIGGAGLWLRAEPDHNAAQSDALASVLLDQLTS